MPKARMKVKRALVGRDPLSKKMTSKVAVARSCPKAAVPPGTQWSDTLPAVNPPRTMPNPARAIKAGTAAEEYVPTWVSQGET